VTIPAGGIRVSAAHEELMFALRSAGSERLGLLLCALDEALQDGSFGAAQRACVAQLLASGHVPAALRLVAEQRIGEGAAAPARPVEDDFADVLAWIHAGERAQPARPKLTLVGSAAA